MKTKIFGILLVSIFLLSCASVAPVAETNVGNKVDENLPIPWKQGYFPNIFIKDSVLFYNSAEILLESDFFKQAFFVEDGVVNVIDSINNISKIVPILTAGAFIEMKKNSQGVIDKMMISFSRSDKVSYSFIFYKTNEVRNITIGNKSLSTSESFTLSGKGELTYNGKKYPVIASTTGDCILLFYYKKTTIKNEIKEQAEGYK